MSAAYIAASVPVFFLLMGLEWWLGRHKGIYRLNDTIASISCGVIQQLTGLFTAVFVVGVYAFLYENFRFITLPRNALYWIVLFFAVDLGYYWFHRVSHRVAIVWATHVVHHQSEEYNLSTALRQSAFQGVMSAPFYWPLALLGFATLDAVIVLTINTLYQFWIHTRLIGRLGPLEWVMNTPSHHRVHHGIDPLYIDKNYAGVFIIWDRLFKTFEPETLPAHYGVVKPLNSWNPLWANFALPAEIIENIRASSGLREKLYALVAPPEWRPAALGGPVIIPDVPADRKLYDTPLPARVAFWAVLNFLVASGVVVFVLLRHSDMPRELLIVACIWVAATLTSLAGLFESKLWALPVEIARLGIAPFIFFRLFS